MSIGGLSFENILHSNRRWLAVCIAFSGELQFGEGVLLILWKYIGDIYHTLTVLLPKIVSVCVKGDSKNRHRQS